MTAYSLQLAVLVLVDPFINSELYDDLAQGACLTVVDGGARGDVFSPFDGIEADRVEFVRFEPEPGADISKSSNQTIMPVGLWSSDEQLKLYVAQEPSTSSVFPPNRALLEKYEDKDGYPPRRTVREIDINVTSIDRLTATNQMAVPDFIKLDIHGAEYEAIVGAEQSLKSGVIACWIETWTVPVNQGQKTHAMVESLLNGLNFYLVNQRVHSFWQRKGELESRGEIIAYESLYFRDFFTSGIDSKLQGIKAIAVAELYFQIGLAMQLVEEMAARQLLTDDEAGAINVHLSGSHRHRRAVLPQRILRRLQRLVRGDYFLHR